MIEIKNLTVKYGDKVAVNNVSLEIKRGKITTIIGPNGCGKSTLIKAISGLFKESRSEIVVDGKRRDAYERKEFARKVSFLMQFTVVPPGMSVHDLVCFGRMPYLKMFQSMSEQDYEYIEWAMHKTSVYEFKDTLVTQLSGGERQRVFLALALAQKTEVLILDEPTNHLDLKYQHELLSLVQTLNREEKLTIVYVLHDVNQAMRYSDEIFVMKKGEIVVGGAPQTCITKEIMHDVYDVNCIIDRIGEHPNVSVL
jgi:ABC-type cobalamin/Fe3+-siderophores transport systems, ATPase components